VSECVSEQDWLWCESWCSDESKATAKTIDLCNNPLHKEPKLDMAKRTHALTHSLTLSLTHTHSNALIHTHTHSLAYADSFIQDMICLCLGLSCYACVSVYSNVL